MTPRWSESVQDRTRARHQSPRRPVPAPARPRHLTVVRGRPAPGRRPPVLWVAVAGTAVSLFALVILNVLVAQAGIERTRLERRLADGRIALERLELRAEQLGSPDRIYRRALEIGLVPAAEVIVLTPDGATEGSSGRTPSPGGGGR